MKQFNKTGFYTATLSFTIDTLLIINFIFLKKVDVARIGYIYLITAILINTLIAIYLSFSKSNSIIESNQKRKSVGLMLINIPIAFVYFLIFTTYLF